ncbi:hypothetical protein J7E95_14695 [Streptomyces sp. ISL-14]|nr:hypothetical protein [Streptomyces sp. ISL-14]
MDRDFPHLGMSGGLSAKGIEDESFIKGGVSEQRKWLIRYLRKSLLLTGIMWVVRGYFSGEICDHFNNFNEIFDVFKN